MHRPAFIVFGALSLAAAAPAQTFFGPTPYLSIADTPFDLSGLGSTAFLEDFEDGILNLPGAYLCPGAPLGPGGNTDSVDADDGAIDGLGQGGTSFYGNAPDGMRVNFSEGDGGELPTFAGLVWTDGAFGGDIEFEAFDATGASLGTLPLKDAGDNSFDGTTAEDRFFGVEHDGGISAILIRIDSGFGIEIDHVQYGGLPPQDPPPDCYPDCDGDGVLSLFDFLCFVNAFNASSSYADCDTSGCAPSLDLFDFLCYTNAFNAGC
jgi:hypothetical protein